MCFSTLAVTQARSGSRADTSSARSARDLNASGVILLHTGTLAFHHDLGNCSTCRAAASLRAILPSLISGPLSGTHWYARGWAPLGRVRLVRAGYLCA